MIGRFVGLLAGVAFAPAMTLLAQGGASDIAAGTFLLQKNSYPLKHAAAYEMSFDDEDGIVVVLSGQKISGENLKEVHAAEKEGYEGSFKRPFLKLLFKKTGELKYWSAGAGETTLGQRGVTHATGEFKLEGGRIRGKASQPLDTEGMFPAGFDVHFDVPLLKAGESPAAKKQSPAANIKPSVTGTFKGNGKEAKLNYVSARWGEPFDGKAGIVLVFTERDHAKAKKPDFDASFGKFGSALILSVFEDGQIYGCQVVHSAHKKQGFSSTGNIDTNDFTYQDGKLEGEVTTHGQVETFGETWEVNLKFIAPLGETPKELRPAEADKPKEEEKPATTKTDDDRAGQAATQPAASGPKAKDLALTKDASNVEYKSLVGQISFQSKTGVKSVCKELAANLKAQGWTTEGSDMIQATSSILRRKQGEATLTIFVKPADGGSEVKMMTEGLSWDGE